VANSAGKTILYAAHVDGVSTSTNAGRTWRQGRGFPGGSGIMHVAASATDPAVAYAGGWVLAGQQQTGEVFVSTDGGRSWRATGLAREGGYVSVLVVDPSDSGTVYAGTGDGLYRTTTGGDQWQRLVLRPGHVTDVAVEPGRPGNLYAAVERRGLFRSTDGGATWRGAMAPSRFGGEISAIAFDPLAPGVLYVGTGIGIYRSGNGSTWRHVYGGPRGDDGHVHALAFDPRAAGTMYAVTYCDGIIKSRDGGRSWRVINRGFVAGCRPPYDLEVDPRNSRILYALTPDVGLFKSTDGGGHWRRTPQP
jgi:photosystem II stability/assembly factor-like uncharacterized protein